MTRRPRVLAAGTWWVAGIVVVLVVSFAFSYGPGSLRMSLLSSVAVSVAAAALVAASGRLPGIALGGVVLMTLALPLADATFEVMWLVTVLVGVQAIADPRRPVILVAIAVLGALVVDEIWRRVAFDRSLDDPTVLMPLLLTALVVGLGTQLRRAAERERTIVELQSLLRDQAVHEERRRIARDIHDVAAHHLSAIVVRNRLARRIGTPEALEVAADFTDGTAREALDSLRDVVGVLHDGEPADLRPQPSLTDLSDTVARMRSAGLAVACSADTIDDAPRGVQVAAVRIAQEALANVLRHRGPGNAWLDLARVDGRLRLVVDDDGPRRSGPPLSEGRGIVGMRERAEACGGHVDLGPSPYGGWRIVAELPVRR